VKNSGSGFVPDHRPQPTQAIFPGSITCFLRIVCNQMKMNPLFACNTLIDYQLSFFHDPIKRFIVFGAAKLQVYDTNLFHMFNLNVVYRF
jgi:hypothetical protein